MKVRRNSNECLEPITGTLHVPGQQPKDTATLERGGAMQDGTDVPFRTGRHLHVHGAVTNRGQTLEKMEQVRMAASKGLCWNEGRGWWQRRMSCTAGFSLDHPRLRVDGRVSNRNVHEGKESGRARLEQLVKRVGRHADGVSPASTSAKPSLAAFATRSKLCTRQGERTLYAE